MLALALSNIPSSAIKKIYQFDVASLYETVRYSKIIIIRHITFIKIADDSKGC